MVFEKLTAHGPHNTHGPACICSRIDDDLHVLGYNCPILFYAGLNPDFHSVPGPGGHDILPPVVNQLHRPSCLHGKQRCHRLCHCVDFSAESAAHPRIHHPYLAHGESENPAQVLPVSEHILAGRIDGQLAAAFIDSNGCMCLNGAVVNGRCGIRIFIYIIRCLKPRLHITGSHIHRKNNIAFPVNGIGSFLQRFPGVCIEGQLLIFHLD